MHTYEFNSHYLTLNHDCKYCLKTERARLKILFVYFYISYKHVHEQHISLYLHLSYTAFYRPALLFCLATELTLVMFSPMKNIWGVIDNKSSFIDHKITTHAATMQLRNYVNFQKRTTSPYLCLSHIFIHAVSPSISTPPSLPVVSLFSRSNSLLCLLCKWSRGLPVTWALLL